jgi:hypothetical protein
VGRTTGRGRMDREHKAHAQAIKDIYVYHWSATPGNVSAVILRRKQVQFFLFRRNRPCRVDKEPHENSQHNDHAARIEPRGPTKV